MRISDWSSDVCSSDLAITVRITRLRRVIIAIIITAIVVIAVVIITIVVAIVVARRDRGTDAETDVAADERRRGRIVASVLRSAERRGGTECVRTCRSGWWPYH